MNEKNQNQNEQKQIKPQSQQIENEVFESVSESSGQEEQQPNYYHQDFTLSPITFPSPEPNTLKLLDIYQQNASLIDKLKSQIKRLSEIKKENLFIKHDCVKINFQQEESQFFLRSQQLYRERQQELKKINHEIRTIDQQQLTTLMSKNLNILNLAEIYFSKFRNIIDAKIYGQELILLTQEKKKINLKKKKRYQQQQIIEKLSKINSRSHSGMKNSQQKINTIAQDDTKNQQQRSNNDSKISTPRKRDHEKFNSIKRVFKVRFVHLTDLFPQFQQRLNEREGHCFIIGTKTDCVPRSFVYDSKNKLILVLYQTNVIYAYGMWPQPQELIKQQQSISHKSHALGHNKLRQVCDFKIEFDKNVNVVLFQLHQCSTYLVTSDGILRVYHIEFDMVTKRLDFEIRSMMYCLNYDKALGEIQSIVLNRLNSDELFFVADNKTLCKLNINKYKTEIVHKFDEKVIKVTENYIETDENINLDYMKGVFQPRSKKKLSSLKINDEKNKEEQLKMLSFIKQERIYFVRINKYGLVSGFCEQYQQQ